MIGRKVNERWGRGRLDQLDGSLGEPPNTARIANPARRIEGLPPASQRFARDAVHALPEARRDVPRGGEPIGQGATGCVRSPSRGTTDVAVDAMVVAVQSGQDR